MSGDRDIAICVAIPTDRGSVQTFVEAHVRNLPGRVETIYERPFAVDGQGRSVRPSLPARALGAAVHRALGVRLDRRFEHAALAKSLKRLAVDVVLAEFGLGGVMVQEACRRAGVPFVVHFHGTDAHTRPLLDRWGRAYRRMFQKCAAAVAVSRPMQEQLVHLGAPPEKVLYNPYGVDLERFSPVDAGANPPKFVGVGRFVEKKAPHVTLLAFRRVLDACPDARLLMIGDGPLLPACRDMAAALGMSGAAELPGRQPHERIAEAMADARAFVQHSVTAESGNAEGMPNSILEAGARALPVVSTRHAGIPEAVAEGETGFLVDERDMEGMADHMIVLARDPALAARLGAAARRRIAAEFSMGGRIGALYDRLREAAEGR